MKKTFAAILALSMAVCSLAACGGKTETAAPAATQAAAETKAEAAETKAGAEVVERTWKFSTTRAEGTDNDKMAHQFKDSMEAALPGLTIDMYPNNQLGDYTVVQEAVGLGDIELMLGSISNGVDPTMSVQIAPYLVNTWDEAKKFYNSEDGIIYKYIEERLQAQNIHLLAVFPKYFGGIMTTEPVTDPENPTGSKGVKIRVPQMKSFEMFASSIGFQTTPLPTSDTFTALQTGVVNGACGGGVEQYYSDYGELAKHVYCYRTHMENHWLYISDATWQTLTAEEQEKVTAIAKEWESDAYALAIANEEKYNGLFEEQGVEVVTFPDEVIAEYASYVRENVWPEIGAEYGDIWNDILAKIEE